MEVDYVKPWVYLGGPMSGFPDLNRPAFERAAQLLEAQGKLVRSAAETPRPYHDGPCPPSHGEVSGEHTQACWMRAGLEVMLACDELYLLDGWQASVGARFELYVAAHLGMPIFFQERIRQ